ncbi:MAG: hypothetical protein JO202_11690 [Ktedonobacteraceae bacterium]|nr:hypothetical protein [Ktedonobacteraceae bacterium]
MGITLGQLPPAELARLKAELAETIIANFCYPRFYDYRTGSLRMRPVDRAKRQEVWLFLSSVDFTAWNRIDVMSDNLQHHIERLFIQFVQRNRSFFGEQARKRMPDVRMLIETSAASVVQGLRNHVTGPRQSNSAFGSPRPVILWTATDSHKRAELSWEQIAAQTMLLQQQLQEVRGEPKPAAPADGRLASGTMRRAVRHQLTELNTEVDAPTAHTPIPTNRSVGQQASTRSSTSSALPPSRTSVPLSPNAPRTSIPARSQESTVAAAKQGSNAVTASTPPSARVTALNNSQPTPETIQPPAATTPTPAQARPIPQSMPASRSAQTTGADVDRRAHTVMLVGVEDVAIFEQMRHQLIIWLRIEAVRAGIELSGKNPSQLLELVHQQARMDETRLQVVSTLLSLAAQVIKSGQVSVLDYKQALMLHLMHTRHTV